MPKGFRGLLELLGVWFSKPPPSGDYIPLCTAITVSTLYTVNVTLSTPYTTAFTVSTPFETLIDVEAC